MREHLLLIGGSWRPGRAGTAAAISPSSGETFATMAVADRSDVDDAVAAAGAAAPSWAARSAFERAAWCEAVAAAIGARTDDLAHALAEYFRMAAEDAKRLAGTTPPSTATGRRVLALRVPLGVVGVVSPWNWPYTMGAELFA